MFAAAYVVYNAARWMFAGDLGAARAHARWIVALEQSTGVSIERSVQHAFDAGAAAFVASNVYLAAQFVVVPTALVWLYRRAPGVYLALRNTLLATWALAVPIFALFPVAPPRLARIGIADTVSAHAPVALSGRSTVFYNQLAAVPSLHVGFAVAVGVALAFAARRAWAKALALSWGSVVALAVVATGNHYVFDIGAGLVVTALGFATARSRVTGGRPEPSRGHGYLSTRSRIDIKRFVHLSWQRRHSASGTRSSARRGPRPGRIEIPTVRRTACRRPL